MRNSQRCLLCGSPLAFLTKLSTGAFCCDEHRDRYRRDLDHLVLSRLRRERRRLRDNGSIAPAPLCNLIKKRTFDIMAPGPGLSTVTLTDNPAAVVLPRRRVVPATGLGESPYLHAVSPWRNPGLKTLPVQPRTMRRSWPVTPHSRLTIRLRLPSATMLLPAVPQKVPVEQAVVPVEAIGFPRPFAMSWDARSERAAAVRKAGQRIQLPIAAPPVRRMEAAVPAVLSGSLTPPRLGQPQPFEHLLRGAESLPTLSLSAAPHVAKIELVAAALNFSRQPVTPIAVPSLGVTWTLRNADAIAQSCPMRVPVLMPATTGTTPLDFPQSKGIRFSIQLRSSLASAGRVAAEPRASAPDSISQQWSAAAFPRNPLPCHVEGRVSTTVPSANLLPLVVVEQLSVAATRPEDPLSFPRPAVFQVPAIAPSALHPAALDPPAHPIRDLPLPTRALSSGPPEPPRAPATHPALSCSTPDLGITLNAGLLRTARVTPKAPSGLEGVVATGTPADFVRGEVLPTSPGLFKRGVPAPQLLAAKRTATADWRRRPAAEPPSINVGRVLPETAIAAPRQELSSSALLLALERPCSAGRLIAFIFDAAAAPFSRALKAPEFERSGYDLSRWIITSYMRAIAPGPRPPKVVTMLAMGLRPLMPRLRVAVDGLSAPRPAEQGMVLPAQIGTGSAAPWHRAIPYWTRFTAGISVAVLAVAVYGSMTRTNATQAKRDPSVIASMVGDMRRDLATRAAVNIREAFDPGLTQWSGPEDWRKSWASTEGEIFPGTLAVFQPSVQFRSYNAEFTAQLTKKAVSFAVRARNLENYYAVRFVVVKPGLMPEVVMERYPVIAGEALEKTRVPVHMPLAHDSLYHVRLDLKGSDFVVYLNDMVVDSWTDNRFPLGGIGFFTNKGEKARITGFHIWHQDDTVGRFLAHITD